MTTPVAEPAVPRARFRFPRIPRWGILLGVAALYTLAGLLGLQLAIINPSATAVWPPTGIALAALLLLGRGAWPAVFLGALVVHLLNAGSIATSLAIAVGNTLEAVLGSTLVVRFANGRHTLDRARDVFMFTLLAALLSTTVAATVGVTSLAIAGFAQWPEYARIWTTWWLGDAAGAVVVTPLILLWAGNWKVSWSATHQVEATIVLVGLLLAGQLAFAGLQPSDLAGYPMAFLCIPLLVWTAYRFGAREVATATAIASVIAINGTLKGFGPFAGWQPNEGLLLLQTFIGATAVMTLAFATVVSERDRVEAQLRDLAVTDALTGLANYRQLLSVLETEIQRSSRTGRPFAVLLLDLDKLKKINDAHGHLVGSRALVRLANALRGSVRALDTTARYGGDEFAVVLPEASEDAARTVSLRISRALEADAELPPVRASLGMSFFPKDGGRAEELISVADRGLYAEKKRRYEATVT